MTGAYIWSYATGEMVVSSPAIANDIVYIGSYNHILYAFGSSSSQQTYSVSFTASGLPADAMWKVTLNSQTQNSTSNSIIFNVPERHLCIRYNSARWIYGFTSIWVNYR